MKTKSVLLVAFFLATFIGANAQKGVDSGTQYGIGADSVRCVTNISLYQTDFAVKNYEDAFPKWKAAYDECPAASRNLYIHGVALVKWQLSEEQDPVKREALINNLMSVYDQRVKYFGDDPRYGKDYIIAAKATDYMELKGENVDPALLYGWLNEVIEEFQTNVDPKIISYLMFASQKFLGIDVEKYRDQFINDFLRSSALLDGMLNNAKTAGNETALANASAYKSQIENAFTTSGMADCETMESVFAPKIEANQKDLAFLKETITLFRRVGCIENESYFLAGGYAHKIDPTAESAAVLGSQSLKRNDYATAEKYFLDAASLTTDDDLKASANFLISNIALMQKNYSKVRQFATRALEANPNFGRAYINIGQAYAATAASVYPDDMVLRKIVYCLAVDKFERARQVDPSIAADANSLISSYRAYFPSTEEVFMHPDVEAGASFTVGGWINERTTVRVK